MLMKRVSRKGALSGKKGVHNSHKRLWKTWPTEGKRLSNGGAMERTLSHNHITKKTLSREGATRRTSVARESFKVLLMLSESMLT